MALSTKTRWLDRSLNRPQIGADTKLAKPDTAINVASNENSNDWRLAKII